MEKHNKIVRQIGRPTLYNWGHDHFKSSWVTRAAAIHSHRVGCWPHLEGRLEHDDVSGRLDPGLAVHVHGQLGVGANLDMASLQE